VRQLALACAVASTLAGCTLLGFDDLELTECRDNEVCRELNVAYGLDPASDPEVYQCAPDSKGCVLSPTDWDRDGALLAGRAELRDCDDAESRVRPGLDDSCDALDNDCDGTVDEGVFGSAPLEPAVTDLGAVFSLDFGSLTSGRESGSLDLSCVAEVADEKPGGASLLVLTSAANQPSPLRVSADAALPGASCPAFVEGEVVPVECYPRAIATDAADGSLRLAAALDHDGCLAGRLRLGRVAGDRLQVLGATGADGCDDAFPFVSADGSDVAACTAREGVRGVSQLELAQLPARGKERPTQALVSWIGAHDDGHDVCGEMSREPIATDPVDALNRTSVGVAALAFWPAPGSSSALVTSGVGGVPRPELLGVTRGGGAPAVEPVVLPEGSEHYVVAFGSERGPALHAIERVVTPAQACEVARPLLTRRSAEPWHDESDAHFAADHFALAAGPELADACGTGQPGARLGLAWVEGCGLAKAELWFATVDFAPSTGFCRPSAPELVRSFDQTTLARSTERDVLSGLAPRGRLSPVVAYLESGVQREPALGGFVLAWIEGDGRVFARRAAAGDGKLIDAAVDLGVSGARALGARRVLEGWLELAIVRTNASRFELVQKRLSNGCGG
jgi:hypothetical protein